MEGLFMLMIVLVVVFVPAWLINMAAYQIHPLIGIIVESILNMQLRLLAKV